MRLTPEVIRNAPIYLNPIRQREISLRGLRCTLIENLGITEDLNESMDLANNDLTRLDNFPTLTQLKTLIVSNNRIYKLDPNISNSLPNLEALVLTNNRIRSLSDLQPLVGLTKLTSLYLVGNPVDRKLTPSTTTTSLNPCRVAIAALCPELTVLNFSKVSVQERKEANTLRKRYSNDQSLLISYLEQLDDQVSDTEGKDMERDDGKEAEPESMMSEGSKSQSQTSRKKRTNTLTDDQQRVLRDRIEASSSLEELESLASILSTGVIPEGFVW